MRVAGFGFRASVSVAALQEVLALAGGNVSLIATAEAKVATPGFQAFARQTGLPVRAIAPDGLRAHRVAGSDLVQRQFGTGSVAESAALAAAGPGARLIGARVTSRDGTAVAAIAEGSS